MSEAQIFVNNCIWGTNWLQTGKRQTAQTVQLALQRRCSSTFTLFLHENGAIFGRPCKNAYRSTMRDHKTDMHKSISFTAFSAPFKTAFSTLTIGEIVLSLT